MVNFFACLVLAFLFNSIFWDRHAFVPSSFTTLPSKRTSPCLIYSSASLLEQSPSSDNIFEMRTCSKANNYFRSSLRFTAISCPSFVKHSLCASTILSISVDEASAVKLDRLFKSVLSFDLIDHCATSLLCPV